MAIEIDNPFPYFTDRKGDALDQGYVYVGESGQDPELFPIDLFWDVDLTIPAAQPLRTVAGYVVNPGAGNSPANPFSVAGDYSIRIRDRRNVQVFYAATARNLGALIGSAIGSSLVGFIQTGTGAIPRTVQDKLRETVSVKDFGAAGDDATDDSAAFAAAMAASSSVYVPRGEYRVSELTIPDGVALTGAGAESILRLAAGGFRIISTDGATKIEIASLLIDGDGASLDLVLLTSCVDALVHDLWLTGSNAYGLTLDGCGGCDVNQIRVFDSGSTSSHAGIYLKNPTANGSFNRVSQVFFRDIEGRGIFCLGHNQAQINAIRGLMTNGEILLLEDCYGAVVTNITWAGPGAASSSLSDGIAINGNCVENTISSFYGVFSSGHGVSINGQWEADGITPKTGASRNIIGPGVIISPNEGGVIVTDQAVPGSIPAENLITGVVVRDAGRKVASEAFGVTGGVDNQFLGVLSQGTSGGGGTGTSRGFYELAGGSGNVPARNNFRGLILGTYNSGRVSYSSSSSAVTRTDTERSPTRITFDGTTGTVIGTSTNGATVVKNGTGDYTINTVFPNATDIGVVGTAQETAGVPNNVTLTSVPNTTSVRVKVVAAGTATATDSARVYVELR